MNNLRDTTLVACQVCGRGYPPTDMHHCRSCDNWLCETCAKTHEHIRHA
jgi:hypothetical protein